MCVWGKHNPVPCGPSNNGHTSLSFSIGAMGQGWVNWSFACGGDGSSGGCTGISIHFVLSKCTSNGWAVADSGILSDYAGDTSAGQLSSGACSQVWTSVGYAGHSNYSNLSGLYNLHVYVQDGAGLIIDELFACIMNGVITGANCTPPLCNCPVGGG
jgi:hypothetical protein